MRLIHLLVLLLLGIVLSALIVPKLSGRDGTSRYDQKRARPLLIKGALENFRLDFGRYPTTEEGLDALVTLPSSLREDQKTRAYLERESLFDEWGHTFEYRSHSPSKFKLTTFGSDGVLGGSGYAQDQTLTE